MLLFNMFRNVFWANTFIKGKVAKTLYVIGLKEKHIFFCLKKKVIFWLYFIKGKVKTLKTFY